MTLYSKQTKPETIIYTVVWILLFTAPLVELLFNYEPEHPFWLERSLVDVMGSLVSFLVVFLIHNHVLAPILIKQRKITQYVVGCVLLVALFQVFHCSHKPDEKPKGTPHHEHVEMAPPPPGGHPPIDKHDLSMFTIVILMIGANLGTKSYFYSEEEKKHMAKLKEQRLKQELE